MKCIAIGASTGGPQAVEEILSHLPTNLNAVVIIFQHISSEVAKLMAARLDAKLPLNIQLAKDEEVMRVSGVYIVPGETNLFVMFPGVKVKLLDAEDKLSPSIDMGFTSVAEHFGPDAIAVILTGMGTDGTTGASAIRQLGGKVIVQNESTSAIWGMPKSVKEHGLADEVLPLGQIAKRLKDLVGTI